MKDENVTYNRRNLELRAAEYYARSAKPESEWRTYDDIHHQLAKFGHQIGGGDYNAAGQTLNAIDHNYLFLWGYYSRLIELREKLLEHPLSPKIKIGNLNGLGRAFHLLGQIERAVQYYEKACSFAQKTDALVEEGENLGNLGLAYRTLGEVDKSVEFFEKALQSARVTGDTVSMSVWIGSLARSYVLVGKSESALPLYEEALSLAREANDRQRESVWLSHLGTLYEMWGDLEKAELFCDRALDIAYEIGDRRGQSTRLSCLGHIRYVSGEFEAAAGYYRDALCKSQEMDNQLGESYQLLGLTKICLNQKDICQAEANYRLVLEFETNNDYLAVLLLGIVVLYQHDVTAELYFREATNLCRTMLDKTATLYTQRYALATALVGQAVCDLHWPDPAQRAVLLAPALAEYRRALNITAAPGVVRDALRDLELIRAAGIEGLEPVFALLEAALPKPTYPTGEKSTLGEATNDDGETA
ncbi:MAG: tetratricopeptide repeat protein [Anaerolineae bacterium]|nr:tetratricopeptide repeat protein [Anaerolineae bacterium]